MLGSTDSVFGRVSAGAASGNRSRSRGGLRLSRRRTTQDAVIEGGPSSEAAFVSKMDPNGEEVEAGQRPKGVRLSYNMVESGRRKEEDDNTLSYYGSDYFDFKDEESLRSAFHGRKETSIPFIKDFSPPCTVHTYIRRLYVPHGGAPRRRGRRTDWRAGLRPQVAVVGGQRRHGQQDGSRDREDAAGRRLQERGRGEHGERGRHTHETGGGASKQGDENPLCFMYELLVKLDLDRLRTTFARGSGSSPRATTPA